MEHYPLELQRNMIERQKCLHHDVHPSLCFWQYQGISERTSYSPDVRAWHYLPVFSFIRYWKSHTFSKAKLEKVYKTGFYFEGRHETALDLHLSLLVSWINERKRNPWKLLTGILYKYQGFTTVMVCWIYFIGTSMSNENVYDVVLLFWQL